ncbi:MAG: aquaporin [Thermoplasmata archaeon]|nr:aquaporin [Thermoplasmata archaeon]|tara:strand:+ start:3098 stop:3802 length:705 start_codon:yes stop_codon:yes gene_type:complete
MSEKSLESKLLSECIGTFALTFIGAGSIMMGGDLLTVALAHGVVLAIVVTATMNISGAHINPAVTISMMVVKKMDNSTGMKYIASQLVGACIAGLMLNLLLDGGTIVVVDGMGTPAPNSELGMLGIIGVEAILTFLLLFAIWGTAVDPRAPAIGGWGIGMMVAVDIMMGGGLTGAAMNPARWMGTWVFTDMADMNHILYYWAGPLLGAISCSILYNNYIMAPEDDGAKLSDHDA